MLEMNCTNNSWRSCLSTYNDVVEVSIDPASAGSFIGSVLCGLDDCKVG